MTDDRPSELLGQLPRTRPHRRSAKRPVRTATPPEPAAGAAPRPRPAGAKRAAPKRAAAKSPSRAKRLPQPAQPRGIPKAARDRRIASPTGRPAPSSPTPILRTAIQAAGELAEIGLTLSSRALRRAILRLPRP